LGSCNKLLSCKNNKLSTWAGKRPLYFSILQNLRTYY